MFGVKDKINKMNPFTTGLFFLLVAAIVLGMLAVNFVAIPLLIIYVVGIFGLALTFWQALAIWVLVGLLLGGISIR